MRALLLPLLGALGVAFSVPGVAAEASAPAKTRLRLDYAKSSESDFVTVVVGDYQGSPENNYLMNLSWGRRYSDTLFGLPIPMSANVGFQWLDERQFQDDAYGVTAYIKAEYDWTLPATSFKVRLGLGEGLSYVSRIPMSEKRDFAKKQAESRHLLNYLEWTMDVPLEQFEAFQGMFQQGAIEEMSVGFTVWHRSSVFGLMGTEKGGVNFMGFGVEARF
jgi:outer membrane protein